MDTGKTEQRPGDSLLTGEQSNPHSNTKHWVAALVQMNTEKKVSSLLSNLGYTNYVPTQTEIRQWSDRKKKIEKIVIPMVVFISVDKEEEKKLRKYPTFINSSPIPDKKNRLSSPMSRLKN